MLALALGALAARGELAPARDDFAAGFDLRPLLTEVELELVLAEATTAPAPEPERARAAEGPRPVRVVLASPWTGAVREIASEAARRAAAPE